MFDSVDDGDSSFGKFFLNVVGMKPLEVKNASNSRLEGLQERDQFWCSKLRFVINWLMFWDSIIDLVVPKNCFLTTQKSLRVVLESLFVVFHSKTQTEAWFGEYISPGTSWLQAVGFRWSNCCCCCSEFPACRVGGLLPIMSKGSGSFGTSGSHMRSATCRSCFQCI